MASYRSRPLMHTPLSLVDLATIAMAAGCVRSTLPDLAAAPRKLWRLAVPPALGMFVALVILAGAVASLQHDALWLATTAIGGALGLLRGGRIPIETDQVWGLVRTPATRDSVVAGIAILAVALVDGMSGLLPPSPWLRHSHMAAVAALCAGYLAGRAWMLGRRAIDRPHTELPLN